MPRTKRPLNRDAGVQRDASLVVIASEDKYGVESYFRRFRTKRLQIVVLPTSDDGHSAPDAVMKRLDHYKNTEATQPGDQFWICIDTDRWINSNNIGNLKQVLQQCRQKNYNVAISYPCFELWLLLHFADYQPTAGPATNCRHVVQQLKAVAGGYRKENGDRLSISAESVFEAIERAIGLDNSDQALPPSPATQVYKIVQVLIERDSIELPSQV